MLLIAGGELDPNVESLVAHAERTGVPYETLRVGPGTNPSVDWDFQADRLTIDGRALRPSSLFVRYDVFAHLADGRSTTAYRANAWFTTLHGWALAHPEMRMLNRDYRGESNKPFMLDLARRVGLAIPATRISNEMDALGREHDPAELIAKPVTGGGYAQRFDELLAGTERREGRSAAPAFVQERLVAPEVRVYGVGAGTARRFVAFRVVSEALDYRADDASEVVHLPIDSVDADAVAGLGRLMDALGMDYGAADFKTSPETGRLAFLEVNSAPMFSAFDLVSGAAVSDAILAHLAG